MPSDINEKVMELKNDEKKINDFIEEYKPFIIAYCNKSLKRYIDTNNDDEYSIALMAFYEAIKGYNIDKGNFLSYSQRVIKVRLIDYYRKNKKILREKVIKYEGDNRGKFINSRSIENHQLEDISYLRKLEIEDFTKELIKYNITFKDLVKASPKWKSTRIKYNKILNYIIKNEEVIEEIIKNKRLPIVIIEEDVGVPRKTIERSRKYIIAVIIILLGDYHYIKEYITLEV
ncbi:RNA polymerase sigma factor SigI [Clostridium sp. CTA-7]